MFGHLSNSKNKDLFEQLIKLSVEQSKLKTATSSAMLSCTDQGSMVSRIIEMAWEDRTPFEAIEYQFGLAENDVIIFMRNHMHSKSFKLWRKRVAGRSTKHAALRPDDVSRAYCPTQYKHR